MGLKTSRGLWRPSSTRRGQQGRHPGDQPAPGPKGRLVKRVRGRKEWSRLPPHHGNNRDRHRQAFSEKEGILYSWSRDCLFWIKDQVLLRKCTPNLGKQTHAFGKASCNQRTRKIWASDNPNQLIYTPWHEKGNYRRKKNLATLRRQIFQDYSQPWLSPDPVYSTAQCGQASLSCAWTWDPLGKWLLNTNILVLFLLLAADFIISANLISWPIYIYFPSRRS